MRLAEEYDAAQERGEVATGNRTKDFGVGDHNAKPATAADLGLRRDEIHEARRMRDAERVGQRLRDVDVELVEMVVVMPEHPAEPCARCI
jgi:hypothetical protein